MIDGTLNVGPNAVLSFDREGYDGFKINIKDSLKIITNKALFNVVRKYGKIVVSELLKYSNKTYFERVSKSIILISQKRKFRAILVELERKLQKMVSFYLILG